MCREKWAAGHRPALQESAGRKCLEKNGLQDTPRLRFKNLKGGRGGVSYGDGQQHCMLDLSLDGVATEQRHTVYDVATRRFFFLHINICIHEPKARFCQVGQGASKKVSEQTL